MLLGQHACDSLDLGVARQVSVWKMYFSTNEDANQGEDCWQNCAQGVEDILDSQDPEGTLHVGIIRNERTQVSTGLLQSQYPLKDQKAGTAVTRIQFCAFP
jgi:hypothetical protein